jgi:2-haloacid dehalogenase
MPSPSIVVFDFGGVLVDWDPRYLYRKIFADSAEMEKFLTEVCTPTWNLEQDRGRPWAEAVDLLVAEHPHYAAEIRAFSERWEETLNGAIEGTVAILQDLKATDVPLYAITNFSAEKLALARQSFPFLHEPFKGVVVSGDEKLIKPDAAIFHVLFDRYGVAPTDAVFIDDNAHNIATARALGMHGIHFSTPEALRAELQALSLLPS